MTNAMIILNESVRLMEQGIIGTTGRTITVEDAQGNKKDLQEPEPLHTYAKWKELGYQVKKGEKAKAKFTIWKYKAGKVEMEVTYDNGKKGVEEVDNSKMFMKISSFFTQNQVERIAGV